MILIIGHNAAWQKVCVLPRLERGEVNRVSEVHAFASSKGPNVARALAALDGKAEVLGYAGGETGRRVRRSLREEGVRARLVDIRQETRVCTTFAEPSGASTEVIEPPPEVDARERGEFRRVFRSRLPAARLLLIAGSTVAGETEDCYAKLVREARRHSVIALVDAACPAARRALAEGPEILKVNLRELAELTGVAVQSPSERIRAWRMLAARHGIRWFLVTLGSAGMEAFDGSVLLHADPPPVKVLNAIGSGDAASAGAAWAVHQMLSRRGPQEIFRSPACLEETLACATAMGTANCMNPINGRVLAKDYRHVRAGVMVKRLAADRARTAR